VTADGRLVPVSGQGTTTAEERWVRWLPLGLLALATAVAVVTNSLFEDPPDIGLVLGLSAVTGAWVVVWTFVVPPTRRRNQVMYVGRTALAFVLTWLNPFFAVFAFTGFLDGFDHFEGRRAYPGVLVTAVTMAGSQSGGLPPRDVVQWVVVGALLVLNAGLAAAFAQMHVRLQTTSDQRAETIGDLERLNARLERAIAENTRLHETVVAQAREAGVQEERQRLAREIHDTIAQGLAGVVAQLQASQDEPDPQRRRAMVRRATELARGSLTEARRSVLDLGPASLAGAPLPEALTALVAGWDDDHPAKTDLVLTGDVRPLHSEVEATVLRVVQEALTNVAKHARAGRVGVTLSYVDGEVLVDVRDDGVGFHPDEPATGFGLRGMRQRAERLAGALDVESEPGGGTAVSARLPALERGVT
jgi:signal transduction histidine kinase